jgi:hypothetical protein
VEERILNMLPILNEKQRRIFLGNEAKTYGRGGVDKVHEISKASKTTIIQGKKDLENLDPTDDRIRKIGGGRKTIYNQYPNLNKDIEEIIRNETFGNPETPLFYTTQSLRKIAKTLEEKGTYVSHDTIADILKELGYSLQLNQKMLQVGVAHSNRDDQFKFINSKSLELIKAGEPVISVDTKKKELIGNYKNSGAEYREKKNPRQVIDHDFATELGKVVPYGIYDISKNEGFVNLGISKDTAEFAIESISRWWLTLGKNAYPKATKLYINCDGGGSNGSRVKLWKYQLQQFANLTALEVHVSHFPPGTSKWNKIEHKMFCYISKSWRGQPLISVETTINLISNTTTTKGLKITCVKDDKKYELGIKVNDEEYAKINIKKEEICPDWNYVISPNL